MKNRLNDFRDDEIAVIAAALHRVAEKSQGPPIPALIQEFTAEVLERNEERELEITETMTG